MSPTTSVHVLQRSSGDTTRTKTVFLEPLWKLRSEYAYLLQDPPHGYRFVLREALLERCSKSLARTSLAYKTLFALYKIAPVQLLKPYSEIASGSRDYLRRLHLPTLSYTPSSDQNLG